MAWIKTADQLPPENKYVLARHNRGTWNDSDDQENVNCVVVKMVKGISESDREKMKLGLLPNENISTRGGVIYKRSDVYMFGDVHGNNLVPYRFATFGPNDFFGQTIFCWQYIEP